MLGKLKVPGGTASWITGTPRRERGGAAGVGVVDLPGILRISACSRFPLENNLYFSWFAFPHFGVDWDFINDRILSQDIQNRWSGFSIKM